MTEEQLIAALHQAAHVLRASGHHWPEAEAVEWAHEQLRERAHGDHP